MGLGVAEPNNINRPVGSAGVATVITAEGIGSGCYDAPGRPVLATSAAFPLDIEQWNETRGPVSNVRLEVCCSFNSDVGCQGPTPNQGGTTSLSSLKEG